MNKKIILVEETITKYQKVRDTIEGWGKIKEDRRTKDDVDYPL